MKTITFDLDDQEGQPHRYAVELFSCDENIALQLVIGDVLAGPLGKVIGSVATAFAGREAGSDFDLMSAVGKVDWAGTGLSIQTFVQALDRQGGPQLVARVFGKTTRIRHEIDGTGARHEVPESIATPFGRDMAYADGNYVEMWKAFVAVLAVNFGPFGRTGSLSLKDVLSSLTGGLVTPLTPTTGTPAPSSAQNSAQNPQAG